VGEGGVEAEVGAVEEGGEFGQAEGEAFRRGGAKSDMAELTSGTSNLSVEMQMSVRDGEDFRGFREVADEIDHRTVASVRGGAQRQAEDGAKMVFKLAGDGAFDGPVAGVMNAGSHLIGEEAPFIFEKFDDKNAGIFHRFENAAGHVFRGALNGRFEKRGRRERKAENAAAMVVFDERIKGGFASARADREDGKFTGEGDETLEDQFYGRQFGLGFRDVFRGAENPLALAVVTHARGLEDGGKAELIDGRGELAGLRNG